MKQFVFVIILLAVVILGKSQKDFSLADSTFEIGQSINCECIYFEFDKSILKKESVPFLDSMVVFLNSNPSIQLEIQNHTDSRAKISYSINLTQRRAQTAMDYLVNNGIEKKRLTAKGYFNTQLLISDEEINKLKSKSEKEEAHKKNRRTVFVITGI